MSILTPLVYLIVDISILTTNCLYEAVGESFEGKVEVTRVVLNRVQDKRWPNSIRDVVYQPHQFSWTKEPYKQFKDNEVFECKMAVIDAMGKGPSPYNHYYNPNIITPNWASEAYTDIGNHRFLTL